VDRWCERRSLLKGGVMSVDQCWRVAREWYGGRDQADWQPKSPEEADGIFRAAGLEGPHWRFG
jgi:hypothetical protein